MKTIKIVLLLIVSLSFNGCVSQTTKKTIGLLSTTDSIRSGDDTTKPDIKINVNKQYDSKGNIVQYDSTYSYSYSTPNGRMKNISNDSIYKQFQSFFNEKYQNFLKPQQDHIFSTDSLFKYDFLNNDYFYKRFEKNQKLFENMFKQMDSIKGNYLMNKYPNGQQQKK